MGMKVLSVDTDEIAGAVNSIKTQLDSLEDINKYISDKSVSELEPIWSGPAKDAYIGELAAFAESFGDFVKSAAELNDALDKARQRYDAAEQNALHKIAALPE